MKGWHKQSKRHSRASKDGWRRKKAGLPPKGDIPTYRKQTKFVYKRPIISPSAYSIDETDKIMKMESERQPISIDDKLEILRKTFEDESNERMKKTYPDTFHLHEQKVRLVPGKKYVKVDISYLDNDSWSGKYMVDKKTGDIFGIKAYGKVHKGHYYGNLNTIKERDWGGYTASKKNMVKIKLNPKTKVGWQVHDVGPGGKKTLVKSKDWPGVKDI